MNITVVGSGFVGQATGKGLAKHGNKITFLDVDRDRLASLRQEGFRALHPTEATTIDTDVTMFCVPTPTIGASPSSRWTLPIVTKPTSSGMGLSFRSGQWSVVSGQCDVIPC